VIPSERTRLALFAFAVASMARVAFAQYAPITGRGFNLELFQDPTLGESRLIAMGRSLAPVADGKAGLYANPASVALRPDHHADPFDWTGDLTGQSASGDINDHGPSSIDLDRALQGAGSLLFWLGPWGLAANAAVSSTNMTPPSGSPVPGLRATTIMPGLVAARTFADGQLAVGVGLRALFFVTETYSDHQSVFWNVNLPLDGGVVWRPTNANFRLGANASVPIYRGAPQFDCNPLDCHGYVVPSGALVPWSVGVGGAYRWGPSRWNIPPPGAYRDEHNLTVAASLDVTGAVNAGNGVEAYAANELQPTRDAATVTPRLGVEAEVVPGWFRVRGGTYYEASRFPGVASRAHGTTGVELRVLELHIWGYLRFSLSAAGDWADRYSVFALSVGFWD
jgi:hypothetical protein